MKEEFFWEGHPYIALNDLLKMVGVAEICGRAKLTVTDRLISVNGEENLVK
ncbi:RNA-binding S4 domain-containing protein [Ignatzschineria indica]|uniref:RNA-binding S4 domain-containing protein n=1 Tax=Ignatzschineria indica TaxID=472583 RepID=UPI002576B508|nr:RNA-binding S4 domain-containing protein [Ignatzschineria indica]MDM1546083.1 RNA-binding S4 domain-containing protein [Ignatzschineria indica]